MKQDEIYQRVTNRVVEMLERGMVPWRKPFLSCAPRNWKTGRRYRGINVMLLDSGEYATFMQVKDAGGSVNKGEKGHLAIFWKWIENEDPETGEKKNIPFLKCYTVFEINSQCEGLESKVGTESFDPIERAEAVANSYINSPKIIHVPGSAYYMPSKDLVSIPPMSNFVDQSQYYSVKFHELAHSTGHASRLNREGILDKAGFGSETYSKEELVAELSAAMLCDFSGIVQTTLENSTSYIQSWLSRLKDDKKLIVQASSQAQKACDHILAGFAEPLEEEEDEIEHAC